MRCGSGSRPQPGLWARGCAAGLTCFSLILDVLQDASSAVRPPLVHGVMAPTSSLPQNKTRSLPGIREFGKPGAETFHTGGRQASLLVTTQHLLSGPSLSVTF